MQGRFVDNPKGVFVQADQLVRELMQKRGYPMGDFERRAADISVDHPTVVETYRAAQAIAVRDAAELLRCRRNLAASSCLWLKPWRMALLKP